MLSKERLKRLKWRGQYKYVYLLARAVTKAQDMHVHSYNSRTCEAKLSFENCLNRAVKSLKLPAEIARLLYLANTWHNDLQIWAKIIIRKYEKE